MTAMNALKLEEQHVKGLEKHILEDKLRSVSARPTMRPISRSPSVRDCRSSPGISDCIMR